MPIVVCTNCGVKAEGATADEYDEAIPGHPFSEPCPHRHPTFSSVVTRLRDPEWPRW